MSSNTEYRVLLQVVVQAKEESMAVDVQKELSALVPGFSYSPIREQESLNDCLEFMATGEVDEAGRQLLIKTLDRGWDVDEDEDLYWAYGFNTKMFNPNVYYLQLEFTPMRKSG